MLWSVPVPAVSYRRSAFVDAGGTVVVRLHFDSFLVIDPGGRVVTRFELLAPGRIDRNVSRTSVGPRWAEGSRWELRTIEGRLCFVVSTWWGRHVVLDVVTGEVVSAASLEAEQRDAIRELVAGFEMESDLSAHVDVQQRLVAALVAGLLGVGAAVPWLDAAGSE